ncbi:type VII secretion-associated serine protease mycosin [Kitasatospora sp. NPDC050543]|uniref:type VII secretion-associated serine protease mycosin n=1 Tax=Kitasatospora sp. NPDC050543 TaxID=3364054 RepID=UPI003792A7B7
MVNYRSDTTVWPISQGNGVIVAVIDSGVLKDHQDLTGQVLPGADFSGENSDGTVDKDGHGTGMASLIAGHGHGDQAGIMGLAPKSKILPIRIRWGGEDVAEGEKSDVARAVRFAADHGAKVINMSIGGYSKNDSEIRSAVSYAAGKDVVLVASTGNSGNRNRPVEYPAAFPGVVAVGAVDRTGAIWEKSTFGPETTLAAPGAGIYRASAQPAAGYGIGDGTSDATAYVSAIAALVRSKYPELSAGQVINRMIKTAVAPPDGSTAPNDKYGYGIASPSKALAPNPAVDGGSKENPLLGRAESQGGAATTEPAAEPGGGDVGGVPGAADSAGVPGYLYVAAGAVGLLIVVGVVFLIVRKRGNRNGPGPGPGPGPGGGYMPPQQPPYGYPQAPPMAQPPHGLPQGPPGVPPAAPSSGNPYR